VLDLLLLPQPEAVVGRLGPPLLDHAGRHGPPLEGALGGVAAVPLEEQLKAVTATEAADRSGDASHEYVLEVRGEAR
jgi:hypothetical protein